MRYCCVLIKMANDFFKQNQTENISDDTKLPDLWSSWSPRKLLTGIQNGTTPSKTI